MRGIQASGHGKLAQIGRVTPSLPAAFYIIEGTTHQPTERPSKEEAK